MIFAHTFFTKLDTKKMSKTCTQKWTLFVTRFGPFLDPPKILLPKLFRTINFALFSLSASLGLQKGVQKTTFFRHFWPILDPFLGRTEPKSRLSASLLIWTPKKSGVTKTGPPGDLRMSKLTPEIKIGPSRCQNRHFGLF